MDFPFSYLVLSLLEDQQITVPLSMSQGWKGFFGFMPDDTTVLNSVSVFDTEGTKQHRLMQGEVIERAGVQVLLRGENYSETFRKASQVSDTLDAVVRLIFEVGDDEFLMFNSIARTSPALFIGNETDTRRVLFSINALVNYQFPYHLQSGDDLGSVIEVSPTI